VTQSRCRCVAFYISWNGWLDLNASLILLNGIKGAYRLGDSAIIWARIIEFTSDNRLWFSWYPWCTQMRVFNNNICKYKYKPRKQPKFVVCVYIEQNIPIELLWYQHSSMNIGWRVGPEFHMGFWLTTIAITSLGTDGRPICYKCTLFYCSCLCVLQESRTISQSSATQCPQQASPSAACPHGESVLR